MEPLLYILLGAVFAGAGVWLWQRRSVPALVRKRREEAERYEEQLRKEADSKLKELLLHAKEESLRLREQAEDEIREKQRALARHEEKLAARDEQIEERRHQLDLREREISEQARSLAARATEIEAQEREFQQEVARLADLTPEQAREMYLARVESEAHDVAKRVAKEIEDEAVREATAKARRVVIDAMQRNLTEYVTEATVAVVELPSEDMKGRIIGREGRNIRAFEQVTGVDLIIDDTPEAVVISSFDPVRRETARLALMNLMADGRIHPVRIEELYEAAKNEVERMIVESGERAVDAASVGVLPPKVIEMLGRLRFRTSYGQNVLDHSVEVSRIAAIIAAELGLDVEASKRAGLLHDIGKALGPEWEGPHALIGMEYLRRQGEREPVLNAVGAHHYEIEPETVEAVAVIIADTVSAARPGARRESLENYIKRLAALEELANSFPGVDRSYAVQAGREIRLIVRPNEVDDIGAVRLANDVAQRIENELAYPGQIKVTVIRETRVQQVAK
jgi:ribonucrease Y